MDANSLTLDIQKDINEISTLVWEYIQAKYITKLKRKINGYRKEAECSLSKEAQLLKSMIPFIPEQKELFTQILDLIIYNDIIERSLKEYDCFSCFYLDDNKELERIKKIVYKLLIFYIIIAVDKNFNHRKLK